MKKRIPLSLQDTKALGNMLADIIEPLLPGLREGTSIVSRDVLIAMVEGMNKQKLSVTAAKKFAKKEYNICATTFETMIRPRLEAYKVDFSRDKEIYKAELIQAIEDHINGVPYKRKRKTYKIHAKYAKDNEIERTESDE